MIEAGDVLSDGIPNPAIITEHKGVGEGRKYFVKAMADAIQSSGQRGHRRNIELLARGLINHVRLDEETDDNVPGDVVPYSTLEHKYKPRPGHRVVTPEQAVGSVSGAARVALHDWHQGTALHVEGVVGVWCQGPDGARGYAGVFASDDSRYVVAAV
jgi:hypothetical protein